MPFRSWCKHCVKGRAQSTPHYHRDHSEDKVPTISWDYWYIDEKQDNEKGNEEEGKPKEETGLPVVVWADSMSRGAMAYVCPNRGMRVCNTERSTGHEQNLGIQQDGFSRGPRASIEDNDKQNQNALRGAMLD